MKRVVSTLLFCLLFAINFPAFGEETQGQDAQTLLQEARKLITEEKHPEAAEQIETLLKQFPDTPQAKDSILILATCYIKTDQPEKAEATYLNALEKYQNDTAYVSRIRNALGDFYLSQKQYQKAIVSYRTVLETEPDYNTFLQLVSKIEKSYLSLKDYSSAAAIRKQLLDVYPQLLEKYLTNTRIHPFQRARAQTDRFNFLSETHNLIGSLQAKAGETEDSFSTYSFLADTFSQSPFAIKSFHTIAEHLSAQSDYTNAIAFYLNSIARSTTPLLPFKAIVRENQNFVNTHNRERLTAAEVGETIVKIYSLLHDNVDESRLKDVKTSLAKQWEQAHLMVEKGQLIQAAEIYKEIEMKAEAPFDLLARYMTALCHCLYGDYYQTQEILQIFLIDRNSTSYRIKDHDAPLQAFGKTVNLLAVELAGISYFNQGNYSKAETLFRITAPFSSYSLYYAGRCYEFQGRLKEAASAYQDLLDGQERYFAELASNHLARLNLLSEDSLPVSRKQGTIAVYAGEDRLTHGNWTDSYGNYLFILCAMAGHFDITGGSALNLFRHLKEVNPGQFSYDTAYRIYTGNTKLSACRWITNLEETREEFLINPLTGKRRSANWDDQGELYASSEGPDLFFDIPLSEDGLFLLSLYFLNDFNYYEPNRQYTVYLKNKQTGAILTATEVKDFSGGVYKHFLVSGPQELTVRICRDLSLNTLISGVFLDRLKPPLDIPVMIHPESDKTSGTVRSFIKLSENWQDNALSWQNQRKDWLALKKQVIALLMEELSTADTFILRWILAETSRQIPLVPEAKESEDRVVSALNEWIEQQGKSSGLSDALEKIVFYVLDNNRQTLGEQFTALYLERLPECLDKEEAIGMTYAFARDAQEKHLKGNRNYVMPTVAAYRKLMEMTDAKPVAEYIERYINYLCDILQTLPSPERERMREEIKTALNHYLETVEVKDNRKIYSVFHRFVFLKEEEKSLAMLERLRSNYPKSSCLPDALACLVAYYWTAEKQQEVKTYAQEFLSRFPEHPYKGEVSRMAQISFAQYREQLRENRRKQ
jgi:tetratricopeptide (TPR) repeat protein